MILCDYCGRENEGETCTECGMTCCYDHLPPEFHKCKTSCPECDGTGWAECEPINEDDCGAGLFKERCTECKPE